jgi:hypothetical protein
MNVRKIHGRSSYSNFSRAFLQIQALYSLLPHCALPLYGAPPRGGDSEAHSNRRCDEFIANIDGCRLARLA